MQCEGQFSKKPNAITHSPYYGCTVRVVSKANVSYEGVLDGISTTKDRIYLKNVHVNANLTGSPSKLEDPENNPSDTLNAVMIDHLTNDIRVYEQVCLNVRDIQELRLIELPSTFHESKAKLRAIDPCLVDIRLSPSDEHENRSTNSKTEYSTRAPIARQKRGESFGSDGQSALISSSSNESSSSFGIHSNEKFTVEENNDDTLDEQLNRLNLRQPQSRPVTLLAKKVLPKKIERNTNSSIGNQPLRSAYSDQREMVLGSSNRIPYQQDSSKKNTVRRSSPIRVTITSKLNPNAVPFFSPAQNNGPMGPPLSLPPPPPPPSTFTFYERAPFRPRLPVVISPDRSQSLPYGINTMMNNQHPPIRPQLIQNHPHHRFIPPRQMILKKSPSNQGNNQRFVTTQISMPNYRIQTSTLTEKRSNPQHNVKPKASQNRNYSGFTRQNSLPSSQELMTHSNQIRANLGIPHDFRPRRSNVSICSTMSLPYQSNNTEEPHIRPRPISFNEAIGSHRSQRTVSGASSCSSLSLDVGPHSIVQLDSSPNTFTSSEGQYDFEKANEEFRRYLELEELVTRRASTSHLGPGSFSEDLSSNSTETPALGSSYKKEISFFDRISCTATTGTAVAYTEVDEREKNLETFGDDALLISSDSTDNEWQL